MKIGHFCNCFWILLKIENTRRIFLGSCDCYLYLLFFSWNKTFKWCKRCQKYCKVVCKKWDLTKNDSYFRNVNLNLVKAITFKHLQSSCFELQWSMLDKGQHGVPSKLQWGFVVYAILAIATKSLHEYLSKYLFFRSERSSINFMILKMLGALSYLSSCFILSWCL